MAMSKTQIKNKDADKVQQEWSTVFNQDFTTLTGSINFIKKLTAVSLSSLTFMRGIFPETAYGDRELSGIKLKLLTSDSGIDAVDKFIELVRSCYDAVEKKYLQQLSIGICADLNKKDEVLESYTLTFKYSDDDCSVTCNNTVSPKISDQNPTVAATLFLLKSIFTMKEHLKPLPKNAYLTMKLLYNDDITPKDYQPPGFEPSDCEKFIFSVPATKYNLGKIATSIHGYKMYLKSALSKEPLQQYLEESVMSDSQRTKEILVSEDDDNGEVYSEIIPATQKIIIDDLIHCPCNCNKESAKDVIYCTICKRKQHSICYGILKQTKNMPPFYCIECIPDAKCNSQDPDLDIIFLCDQQEQQDLCALRRALVFCSSLKVITVRQIEEQLGTTKTIAKEVIERMEMENFIKQGVLKGKYAVNKDMIKGHGYQQYFLQGGNKENSPVEKFQKTSVESLSKRNSRAKQSNRKTKRKFVPLSVDYTEEDFDEDFESQKKRRCVSTSHMELNNV